MVEDLIGWYFWGVKFEVIKVEKYEIKKGVFNIVVDVIDYLWSWLIGIVGEGNKEIDDVFVLKKLLLE